WVEDLDPQTLQYRYQSDFDLLVVTETRRQAEKIEQNDKFDQYLSKRVRRTPVSLIAEDIQFVNRRLRKKQYFYIDIKRQGIVLYDSGKFKLDEPGELSIQELRKLAEEDFEYWFNCAVDFYELFEFSLSKEKNNKAAFLLHQTTECLYSTILLVFTRYKPNSHDLKKLSKRVASIEPQFLSVFPQGSQEEKARFELLRKAYVNARYKPSYTITQQELAWLAEKVKKLQALTAQLCKEKIERFV
ncbi:MAG TPA: HEPN domain-containing protein, partial [Gammaproteobacteria bacterium]|nr:HEPN domain-containing protein [Gammaproteobacteria bacterium]